MVKEIYLAGGCFWGTQHYLKQIKGVLATEVGYANGNTPDPTYKEVYTDETGYAEAVYVQYDSDVIGLERILELYFKSIDPLSLNKQGEDVGTRYRTGIYYKDAEDLPVIQKVYNSVQDKYKSARNFEECSQVNSCNENCGADGQQPMKECMPELQQFENVDTPERKLPEFKLAVEVAPLKNFYTGEEYHQDYLDKNPDGYCHISAALMEYVRSQFT